LGVGVMSLRGMRSPGTSRSSGTAGRFGARDADWVVSRLGSTQSDGHLLWLGFDRSASVSDARWLRQVALLDVQVVSSVEQAMAAVRRSEPVACVIEYELQGQLSGVMALQNLRLVGMLAPVVMVTSSAAHALAELSRSGLSEVVPVIGRAERYERLREWLDQLRMCLALPA